jgi:DNA-binding Xre family transcriptional regulator
MKSVKTLIDMAAQRCGSDAELARRIGDDRANIAKMRNGRRPVSPETVVLMCDVLELPGEECQEWVAISIIENPKNASRLEVLKRALFACWVLGGASLVTLSLAAPGTAWSAGSRTETRATDGLGAYRDVTHAMNLVAHLLRRWLERLITAPWRLPPAGLTPVCQ